MLIPAYLLAKSLEDKDQKPLDDRDIAAAVKADAERPKDDPQYAYAMKCLASVRKHAKSKGHDKGHTRENGAER